MPGTRSSRSENSDGNELAELPGQRLPDEEAQIGGCRNSNNQGSVQLGHKNEEHDSQSEIGPDERLRLWAELKAETDCDFYVDYLEAYESDYPHATLVRECLLHVWRHQVLHAKADTCAIFELHDGGSSCPSLDLQCSSPSVATMLSALRHPSPTAKVRILLWEASLLDVGKLTALGLGLKIHPEVFRVLLARLAGMGHLRRLLLHDTFPWKELIAGFDERRIAPEIVLLGQYLVTTARGYLPANVDAPPVLVIFLLDDPSDNPSNNPLDKISRLKPKKKAENPRKLLPLWMQDYVRLLEFDLRKRRGQSSSITDLAVRSLTPLLQLYVFRFCEECDFIRTEYLDLTLPQRKFRYESAILDRSPRRKGTGKTKELGALFELRYELRRMVGKSEDLNYSHQLRTFTRTQMPCDTHQDEIYREIEDQLQQAHLEAYRLETEIRDYLQLQTGELALQESRKSIELSSSQIEEAKRVKIFTMLAFIYVPLNLATSIFGMNIEQLNGNGQQVWVFILTAVVALTITGGSWFMIEQINSYRKWQRRSTEERYDGKTHFSLAVRLAMVALLLSRSRGHALWMLKSGAWWRIIVDHRSRYLGPHDSGKGSLTAGEYVSKYIRSQQHSPGGWVRPLFTLSIINKERWRRAPEEDE